MLEFSLLQGKSKLPAIPRLNLLQTAGCGCAYLAGTPISFGIVGVTLYLVIDNVTVLATGRETVKVAKSRSHELSVQQVAPAT